MLGNIAKGFLHHAHYLCYGLRLDLLQDYQPLLFDQAFSDENVPLKVMHHDQHKDNIVNHVRIRQDITFLTAGRFVDFISNLVLEKNKKGQLDLNDKPLNQRLKIQIQRFLDK